MTAEPAGSRTVIRRDILIDAPPEIVWRVVTEPSQISRWFADQVELDLVPGRQGRLTFDQPGGQVSVQICVTAVDPLREFAYRWPVPDGETARIGNSTLVRFVLAAEAGGTRLTVVETDVDELPGTAQEREAFVADHRDGWRQHFERLSGLFDTAPRR